VLIGSVWVLSSAYDRGASEIATAVEMLLSHKHLTLQDSDVVVAALSRYVERPTVSFSDCLVFEVARFACHLPLGTFDRNLSKLDGAQRLVG
jgi:predicted nucleic-acid-binding protein